MITLIASSHLHAYLIRSSHNGTHASYFVLHEYLGGVLIDPPPFSEHLRHALHNQQTGVDLIISTSPGHDQDAASWHNRCDARTITSPPQHLLELDTVITQHQDLLQPYIRLLPVVGTRDPRWAIYFSQSPSLLFVGDILELDDQGWPVQPIDYIMREEHDLIKDNGKIWQLPFNYLFSAQFAPGKTIFGPNADMIFRDAQSG